jgi:hypothetical protein
VGQVVSDVQAMKADQEFISDITSLTMVIITSTVMRWPRHEQLISKLKGGKMNVVDYRAIRILFPDWRGLSAFSFLNYYSKYDYMNTLFEEQPSQQDETIRQIVGEVEERMSVMIGCCIPTAGERVLEMKRLALLVDKERGNTQMKKRKKLYKSSSFAVGPSLVPIVKDNNKFTQAVLADSGSADSGKVTAKFMKRPC